MAKSSKKPKAKKDPLPPTTETDGGKQTGTAGEETEKEQPQMGATAVIAAADGNVMSVKKVDRKM